MATPASGTGRRLADHGFKSTEDVQIYTDTLKHQLAMLSLEVDTAAHDMYLELIAGTSDGSLGDKVTARRMARQSTKPMRQCAADLHAASQHAHGCWKTFQRVYHAIIHPSSSRPKFKFTDQPTRRSS